MYNDMRVEGRIAAERVQPGPPPGDKRLPSERPLVLVVEDSEHDWKIYGRILWYNGFDVLHATDADEGQRLAHRFDPDVLLVDIRLGDKNGLDLSKALKSDPATQRAPIVVLSACREKEYGAQARAAGCTMFLEKPISPVDVVRRIAELVGFPPKPGEGTSPRMYSPLD